MNFSHFYGQDFCGFKTGPDPKKWNLSTFETGKIDFLRKLTQTEEVERVLEFARNFHFEIAYDVVIFHRKFPD